MTEKNMAKADFYTSIVLMAFGISATVMALQMPKAYGIGASQSSYAAPGLLPMILGFIITGLSLIMFVRSILRTRGKVGIAGAAFKAAFVETGTFRIIVTIVLCLGYVLLLRKIWYPLLTFLFVFGFAVSFEYDIKMPFKGQIKKLVFALILALVTSSVISVVFQRLFYVNLP